MRTQEEIIEKIDFAIEASNMYDPYTVGFKNGLRYAKYLVDDKEPEFEDVHNWIPCSERMPEKNGKYLCCWQGKTVDTGFFFNKHFRLYGEVHDNLITAWMPLPEVYQKDGE